MLLVPAAPMLAQGIALTPGTLHVTEGRGGEYVVELVAEPTADVTITVTEVSDQVSISAGASLTFGQYNWDTPQIVRIASTADDNDQNDNVTLTHTATSDDAGYDGLTSEVTVAVEEVFAIQLRTPSRNDVVQIIEEYTVPSTESAFTFGLSTEPNPYEDVVLTFTISDTAAISLSNLDTTLRIPAAQWEDRWTRWVYGLGDADSADELVTVDITASGGGYDHASQTITVLLMDDDAAKVRAREVGGSADTTNLAIEEGDSHTYRVRLKRAPSASVTFALATSDSEALTVATTSLVFTPTDFNTWQSVTINALEDDDANDEAVNVTYTATTTTFAGTFTTAVTVEDDESPTVTVTPNAGQSANENGGTVTYDVSLRTVPAAAFVVTPTSGDLTVATVSFTDNDNDGKLNFTATNYDTAQTVTVTLVDDAVINVPAREVEIHFTPTDPNDGLKRTVTALDDDATVTVTESDGDTEVDEDGGTDDYTVVLDSLPTADVTIAVSSGDTGVATVSPPSLTFTMSNWSTAQTVTVTGVGDDLDNGSNRTATISHGASGGGYDGATVASVTVTATDDETRSVTVTESDGDTRVAEAGGTDAYTVVLNSQPTANVTIAVSPDGTGAATVSATSLTFTTSNWATAQTVTVTGVNDAVDTGNRQTTVTHTASGGDYAGVTVGSVTVTVVDDDTKGVTVTESDGDTQVAEAGGTDSYTVVLKSQPTADVTIAVSSGNTGAATVSATSLTFTTSDWATAQTVTVTGVNDSIHSASNRTATISHTASGGGYGSVTVGSVTVTVVDDDTNGVRVVESDGGTQVAEAGGTDTYTVVLTSQPTAAVTIAVSSGDSGAATVSATSLTFTTSDWATAQTVTVTGVNDDVDTDDRQTTVTHTASGGGYAGVTASVTVTVVDDDTKGVSVTESDGGTQVAEAGGADTYTVVLASEPTAEVSIAVSSGNRSVATVNAASLTFTTSNWDTAQTVTVTGVNDDVDSANRQTTISHSASGGGYGSVPISSVTVTVVDDDTKGVTVTESDGGTQVTEAGGTDTYTVVLASQPTRSVTISVSSDNAVATVNSASLTFTTSNWGTAQTVRVTGVNDDVDTENRQTTISHGASGGGYGSVAIRSISVTVVDDDTKGVTVTESGGDTQVAEAGGTDTYTVVLASQPTGSVTISVSSDNASVATVSPASLVFNAGNWNTARTVTVTGVDDDVDSANRQTTISHSASGGGYGSVPIGSVTVIAIDDDTKGIEATESGNDTRVPEAGGTDTYTVALASQPTSRVTVDISPDDTSVATVNPVSLAFTPGNWDAAQTVTVTGVNDDVDNRPDRQTAVRHSATGGDYADASTVSVQVTAVDDDGPGVTITEQGGDTQVDESGGTDTYLVVLDYPPTDDVTVTATSVDASVATASPASLTFTTGNWAVAQSITVIGVDDDVDNATARRTTIEHAATGGDYDGISIAPVWVTALDDDTRGITVMASGDIRVAENGGADTYAIVLDTEPTANVTIAASANDAGVARVDPASLTFIAANWDTAQTVTVLGVNDDVDNATARRTTIGHVATGGDYDGVSGASVSVAALDDDVRGVTVTGAGNLSVLEDGGTATYTIVLHTEPTGDTAIAVSVQDTGVARTSPASLTFTPANWVVAQTVTVIGANEYVDNDAAVRQTTIDHTATGADYAGVSIVSVSVTALDNDTRGITVAESGGNTRVTDDGGRDTYTIVLASQPRGNVTIAVTVADTSVAMVEPASLTFSASNWSRPRTMTVTGVDDEVVNDAGRQTTIQHVASGADYNDVSVAAVTVTAVDGIDDRTILGFVPAAVDPVRDGFVRVVNLGDEPDEVRIDPTDDWGVDYERVTLAMPAAAARHFTAMDMENGNANKGLSGSSGAGFGDWRLRLTSGADIARLSYIRTADGFLTAMHDAVVADIDAPATLPTFNPGSNVEQVSRLRLVNLDTEFAEVTITGIDDAGNSPGDGILATLPSGRALTYTSAELESGIAARLSGRLGNGEGKWRLVIESTAHILAMSLMSSPTGHLTNLSTVPTTVRHLVPLFPPASDPFGRQGFARVVNRSGTAGTVTIQAHDESEFVYAPLALAIGAGQTRHFNSDDLEDGNPDKGLTGSTGAGVGDWWLELDSALDIQVLSYIRTRHDGFLTSMHDMAPLIEGAHHVVTLDPVSPENQGVLRLLNPGSTATTVTVVATDDDGVAGTSEVRLTVPARRAVNLTSDQLESGDAALDGMLGDGAGRWRLTVTADQPIHVMSLINARQTGHLTNLSTTTR